MLKRVEKEVRRPSLVKGSDPWPGSVLGSGKDGQLGPKEARYRAHLSPAAFVMKLAGR